MDRRWRNCRNHVSKFHRISGFDETCYVSRGLRSSSEMTAASLRRYSCILIRDCDGILTLRRPFMTFSCQYHRFMNKLSLFLISNSYQARKTHAFTISGRKPTSSSTVLLGTFPESGKFLMRERNHEFHDAFSSSFQLLKLLNWKYKRCVRTTYSFHLKIVLLIYVSKDISFLKRLSKKLRHALKLGW